MGKEDRGKVILETIQGDEAEEKVLAYLGKLFRNVPPPWIGLLVKRTPAVLIDDIPLPEAMDLLIKLTNMGARATFVSSRGETISGESIDQDLLQGAPAKSSQTTAARRMIYGVIILIGLVAATFLCSLLVPVRPYLSIFGF